MFENWEWIKPMGVCASLLENLKKTYKHEYVPHSE